MPAVHSPASQPARAGFRRGLTLALAILGLGSAAACGAEQTGQPAAADPAIYGISLEETHFQHWAFQPIRRPKVPSAFSPRSANPIDLFIESKLNEKRLAPSEGADAATWLRRVKFDLTGLPPTDSEVAELAENDTPRARAQVVDRLLADPNYGVRWGRRWLDVVRYADTNGYERDGAKPNAWRYRDWVIDSLNRDKPFDRFLTEQIAGDELPDRSAETLIATTFLRLGTWDDEPADPVVDRYDQMDDILGTVTSAFLGLTLRCARCHNHKFEPLSQIDYARFLAVFDPLKRPQEGRKEFDVPVGTDRELQEHRTAIERLEAAQKVLKEQLATLDRSVRERYLAQGPRRVSAEAFAVLKISEPQRTAEQKKLLEKSDPDLQADLAEIRTADESRQWAAFRGAIQTVEQAAPEPLPRAYILQESAEAPPVTQVFRRGNPATPGGLVDPGVPAVLSRAAVPVALSLDRSTDPAEAKGTGTSGRRLALARWMTDPRHPLVARVIVNRLWQGHFGEGLVSSENDFGQMGSLPTHPELLDWLASTLIESGWSLKSLHRQIVLSATYGQSSQYQPEAAQADVDNRLLWRFPYRRLEAEALRDAVLCASGQLDQRLGGPGVYPKIHPAVLEGQSRPGDGWGPTEAAAGVRRAAYIFVKRSLLVPELELLDLADTNSSCEQRVVSTIPTQALTLLNGEFFNEQALALAQRVIAASPESHAARVDATFRRVLARPPAADEMQAALRFLEGQTRQLRQEFETATPEKIEQQALAAWCLVLFNLNEFAYID